MTIMLPSGFTGGSLHLSYEEDTTIIDIASSSAFSTHAIAWYKEVHDSREPIHSGYCLFLSYNLISGAGLSVGPTLITDSPDALELRQILAAWKERKSPRQMVYIFKKKYTAVDLLSTVLQSKDGRTVRNLQAAAEPLGFHIYLAQVESHGSGMGGDDSDDCGDYTIDKRSWYTNELVNMKGQVIDIKLLPISKRNVIPYNLIGGSPDEVDDNDIVGASLLCNEQR